ncbi:aminotransferase class IV [Flavobacterium agricola]|uniref:branched-chain-amino-acid transaminase n=1 Tax=Flavobacterium agricola TaxID=2870839 RepID=A0ABY6LW32_9FLAO|nr:aminotransferase class IV [Flavobacterium agricola]UYW00446.1 aminotransferase class IV [Flavobacterium agricola]
MYNFNGQIASEFRLAISHNRAFLYGDAVFETIKVSQNKILFLEDHYFRLMASMRILRMEIPMFFTMEFFDEQITNLINTCEPAAAYRIRITVFRESEGFYVPKTDAVSYLIHAQPLENESYFITDAPYEVELFKDYTINAQLLSTIKSTNRMVQITAGIYAKENGYDNCIILNTNKNVAEAIDSNLFLVQDNTIITPPLSDGCLNGILRKHLLRILKKDTEFVIAERAISPFDLQKADELFLTNAIKGIQPITKYRKKTFTTQVAHKVLQLLNASI